MTTEAVELIPSRLTQNINRPELTQKVNRPASATDIPRRLQRYSQIATLWVRGMKGKEIAEELGLDKAVVSTAINQELPEIASATRDFVGRLKDLGYFDKIFNVRSVTKRGTQAQIEMLRQGVWPFSGKVVPSGYKLGPENKILLDSERGPALQRVFKAIASGEIIGRSARQEGFKPDDIYRILRNPHFWMGDIPDNQSFGGFVPGKHAILLDDETWKKIQEMRPGRSIGHLSYGFQRKGKTEVLDERKAGTIRRVFQERCKRKPSQEIASTLGLTYSLVYRMLRNPHYKKVVGEKLWNEAQKVRIVSKERIGTKNEGAIFALLPSTTNEIMKKTGLSWLTVWNHLNQLRKQGKADRQPGPQGKWSRVE